MVMPWEQLYGGARRFWWGGPRTGMDRGVVEHVNSNKDSQRLFAAAIFYYSYF